MRHLIIKTLIFLGSAALVIHLLMIGQSDTPLNAVLIGLAVNIASAPIYFLIVEGLYYLKDLGFFLKTKVLFREQDVRLSISYLYRIKVNDRYLLVKNRKNNYYQLVGGAYKALDSSRAIFSRYKVKPDRKFQTDHGIAKNDLRFTVPGKHVIPMLNWFQSREDREISQWREFCEELLSTNILDRQLFRYIDYSYSTTLRTPMRKAKKLDMQEVLLYEIYDLIPNNEQLAYLQELEKLGDNCELKWADRLLIENLGFNEHNKETNYEIAAHTKWAILERWTDD
ncbi:hypothetical protein [Rubrolithibacter danxiaensis]|uniref:SMODS-associated NUDIX domain-containing protein n=1 Tax=Rubrolithibacter danxiaensis TaxID=3390805 RepID=UPI003BF830E9